MGKVEIKIIKTPFILRFYLFSSSAGSKRPPKGKYVRQYILIKLLHHFISLFAYHRGLREAWVEGASVSIGEILLVKFLLSYKLQQQKLTRFLFRT